MIAAVAALGGFRCARSRRLRPRERGGADLLHVDVMDGHFVPNLSMGPPVVQAVKRVATVPLDVHLMLDNPDQYVEAFVKAGAARVTVHAEVLPHLHRTLQFIKSCGALAGVALNPSTPVGALEEVAEDVDQVLVMSVNPGFGGQTFIPRSESKIRAVRSLLDRAGNPAPVVRRRRRRSDQRRTNRGGRREHPGRRQRDLRGGRGRTCDPRSSRRRAARSRVLSAARVAPGRVGAGR